MKLFSCPRCQQLVFFENVACTRCGQALAYLPDRELMTGVEPLDAAPGAAPGAAPPGQLWRAIGTGGAQYRLCRNWADHGVCNWAVPAADPHELCRACRLNAVIPSLAEPAAVAAWGRVERAKRRLVYSLLQLGLPLDPKSDDPAGGVAFELKQDTPGDKVTTGHSDGVVTINVAEADDPFREKVRVELGEPYRTLLGHFRHEIGHYYWTRLVAAGDLVPRFRALFGDERADYAAALQRHYAAGAPPDWPSRFVSAYASAHPWEDWAETFAHYLHIVDTLETARSHNLRLRPEPVAAPPPVPAPSLATHRLDLDDFDALVDGFVTLSLTLNDLNRSMGLRDPYPFVLSAPAIEKLRFAHEAVRRPHRGRPVQPLAARAEGPG